jgi:hypothetical protein
MEAKQQAVNDLDGYNGNHGDNMVQNLRTITAALEAQEGAPPSEALLYASHELEARGKGGTSQYYVKGLNDAAERLEGHSELGRGDVMTLVQSLLGSVPSEGHPQQISAGGSVFEQVVGLAGSQQTPQSSESIPGSPLDAFLGAQQPQSSENQPESPLAGFLGGQQSQGQEGSLSSVLGGLLDDETPQSDADASAAPLAGFLGSEPSQGSEDPLGGMLGTLLGGQPSQSSGDAPDLPLSALLGSTPQQGNENPLGGILGALLGGGQSSQAGAPGENRPANLIQTLLPAAMAFLQAKQSGAEMPEAMGQALMALLANRRMDPLQAGTPRAAAGGLVAQSMLQALED